MDRQAISRAERAHLRGDAEPVSQPTSAPAFVDSRPGAVTLRTLSDALHESPRMATQRALAEAVNDGPSIAVQRKLRDGISVRPAQLQETPTEDATDMRSSISRSSSFPVQRVVTGVPQFVIHTPAALSPAADTRLQSVVNTLVTALDNDPDIQLGTLIVSVEQEGGHDYVGGASTIEGENPALTRTIPRGLNPSDIEITIQRPFAEAATEGELLGLLAHEVGVHNIPSDFKGVDDFAVTTFDPIQTPRKIEKGNTPSRGYEFEDWPASAPDEAPEARHGNRQHDHVMVADILRNPPDVGGVPPLTRANVYFQTVLSIGDTIAEDRDKTPAEIETQTKELIHIYLVDIARIIASDDGRMPPASHALAINDVYGELFNQVVLPYRAAHAWIPASRPKGNLVTLGYSLVTFLRRVRSEKERNG